MKITICGSLQFATEMKKIQKELENKGHQILMPQSVIEGQSKEYSRSLKEKDLAQFTEFIGGRIKLHTSKIGRSDAILVLNYDKDGKRNYIGPNTFLEMGFAFVTGKKIFTINPISNDDKHDELISMDPCCINNNLELIK
ncbi:MAG: hypothetical protein Q7S55_02405 [Nanoarchaeota archaeon]|nr:hypothetical protein [Nanoarchaeota archaeon]